ncbi:MAG TPA: hybrid sensor histidine kinase/response regulator [Noviherbaspirillum sp.]|jgi:signal transduction histidine kinase/ActR/RegA family two-component response regulator|uniref:hybrid sensor histidine kinase/response regulator n=1 Tax=Noviherbaspirillum sp. TaxID=1926288 RepID=UPI002DDD5AB0|nr:hybrid sensor histidine kinase/response regulator [Noviherbaspirillum sp.]HEV2609817.1 hybrid sensor histidine kinase/response regulator [Noviherbaspirillum sp.]
MFPITAVGFIVVSAVLLLETCMAGKHLRTKIVFIAGIGCCGLAAVFLRAFGWAPPPLSLATGANATFWSLPAPVTSGLFLATGASLGLMHVRRAIGIAQTIAIGTLLFSLLTVASYLSRETFLYQLLPGSGTALPTALAFMLAATGLVCLRPHEGVLAVLSQSAAGNRTLRQLLVPALLSPVLLALVTTAALERADYHSDIDTIVLLFAWGLLIVLTIVIWRFAHKLHHADLARSIAEKERNEALAALHMANERKNEFLAMLAHELRNPLAPISASADLLKTVYASDPSHVRRTSEVISRQVNHMVHLVNDLLDVSRVTRGMITLDKQKLDLAQLVADALEQVQPLLEMKGHNLVTDLPSAKVHVQGDHKRLVQVLANLLNNAAKYTPDAGCLRLQVSASDSRVTIMMQDHGIGITPELLPDIFGLFTQAKRTPDRSQGGLGLGLALVKNLVELHGGQVAVHSEGLGKGSVFSVVLPRMAGELHQGPDSGQVEVLPRRNNGLAIMVVDDNVDAADTLSALLEAAGHDVVVHYAPQPALEQAQARKPDVCIVDVGLPGLNGYELAALLRKTLEAPLPALIALTGYSSEEGRAAAADAGFDRYFVKPVDAQVLADALADVAVGRQMEDAGSGKR